MWSVQIAVVSSVPGAHEWKTWKRGSCGDSLPPKILSTRRYWLPGIIAMFSHVGAFGSAGGFSASRPVWHAAQVVPSKNGGPLVGYAGLGNLRMPTTPLAFGSEH